MKFLCYAVMLICYDRAMAEPGCSFKVCIFLKSLYKYLYVNVIHNFFVKEIKFNESYSHKSR